MMASGLMQYASAVLSVQGLPYGSPRYMLMCRTQAVFAGYRTTPTMAIEVSISTPGQSTSTLITCRIVAICRPVHGLWFPLSAVVSGMIHPRSCIS